MELSVMEARDELRDRLALASKWVRLAIERPDAEKPDEALEKTLIRYFVEKTEAVTLDELGRYVSRCDAEDEEPEPIFPWLTFQAVRAVVLARRLREAGAA